MDSETVERVTGWDAEPFTGGFAGLRDLADAAFTGAVTDGMAWLFMLNGRVVGVFDGDIGDFEDADGTAHSAPHPSLPLLFAMREQGGETRAKYYTEDTPLEEAHRTLKSGNFTGYVELSENVLSGDYYVVYQGGKSMSAAYVGNSGTLLTDDEAFDRAADEVGIYEVTTVDVAVVDIPAPADEGSSDWSAGAGVTTTGTDEEVGADEKAGTDEGTGTDEQAGTGAEAGASAEADDAATAAGTDEVTREEPDADDAGAATDDAAAPQDGVTFGETDGTAASADERDRPRADPGDEDPGSSTADREEASGTAARDASNAGSEATQDQERPASGREGPAPEERTARPRSGGDAPEAAAASAESGSDDAVFHEEAEWREARTIPALDPAESADVDRDASPVVAGDEEATGRGGADRPASASRTARQAAKPGRTTNGDDPSRELKRRLDARTDELASVREERDDLAEERDRLRAEMEDLREERDRLDAALAEERDRADRLEARVGQLEDELDSLESELAEATDRLSAAGITQGETKMSPGEALAGTNLFVRYASQGQATLEDAHDGRIDREEVNGNLRLEHHTGFDEEGVVVEGQAFEDFLTSTVEYGFSRWVVQDLLYDVRETGNESGLQALYDAIPDIDRIEFRGAVAVEDESGESREETFDVVVRDRMGNPLLVADLNDARDPASESMLRSLIESTTPVSEGTDTLAAAFCVTTSFFEPGALETAADATGGGLLGRSKRKSFVKLSRKQGYHLCLVETRNGEFHVNVPEL